MMLIGKLTTLLRRRGHRFNSFSAPPSPSSSSSSSGGVWPYKTLVRLNEPDQKYGATPLYYAAQRGNLAEVRRLLRFSHVDVNTVALCTGGACLIVNDSKVPSAVYRAPLHVACARGHLDIVRELLAHQNIDVNLLVNNFTPLHAAVSNGQLEVLRILLADPRINVNAQDENGDTGMHRCCALGSYALLQELCLHPGLDFEVMNDAGLVPFVLGVAHGETDLAQRLLRFRRSGVWA